MKPAEFRELRIQILGRLSSRIRRSGIGIATTIVMVIVSATAIALAQSPFSVIYSFGAAGAGDGGSPVAVTSLLNWIADNNGMMHLSGGIYGVTLKGGASADYGTIFQLTPDTSQQSGFGYTTLYTLPGTDIATGYTVNNPLALAGAIDNQQVATLYAVTAMQQYITYQGALLSLVRDPGINTSVATMLAPFYWPYWGFQQDANTVLIGKDGAIYGSCRQGQDYQPGATYYTDNGGTIFRYDPNAKLIATIHSFPLNQDTGGKPNSLVQAPDVTLYGTTEVTTGESEPAFGNSGGTVFKMVSSGPNSAFGVLHTFTASDAFGANQDGYDPIGVTVGSDGRLYGTCRYGGSQGNGTAWRLDPVTSDFTVLYNFGSDQSSAHVNWQPQTALTSTADGTLYGAVTYDSGASALYVLAPDESQPSGYTYTEAHAFDSSTGYPEGNTPVSLVLGADSAIYGACRDGGANGTGSVFRYALPLPFPTTLDFTWNTVQYRGDLIPTITNTYLSDGFATTDQFTLEVLPNSAAHGIAYSTMYFPGSAIFYEGCDGTADTGGSDDIYYALTRMDGLRKIGHIQINVGAQNHRPVADNFTVSTNPEVGVKLDFMSHVLNPDGNTVYPMGYYFAGDAHGSINYNVSDNSATYTPRSGFTGSVTLYYLMGEEITTSENAPQVDGSYTISLTGPIYSVPPGTPFTGTNAVYGIQSTVTIDVVAPPPPPPASVDVTGRVAMLNLRLNARRDQAIIATFNLKNVSNSKLEEPLQYVYLPPLPKGYSLVGSLVVPGGNVDAGKAYVTVSSNGLRAGQSIPITLTFRNDQSGSRQRLSPGDAHFYSGTF